MILRVGIETDATFLAPRRAKLVRLTKLFRARGQRRKLAPLNPVAGLWLGKTLASTGEGRYTQGSDFCEVSL